jgi:hypothetical protein
MLHAEQVEELICIVAEMNRASLITHFHSYPSRFPVDFTREYLETESLERLRHIFVALCLQQQRLPDWASTQAA